MDKRLTREDAEAHTWTQLEKCLERTSPEYHDQVKSILTEINTLALKNGCYSAMGTFYANFFSIMSILESETEGFNPVNRIKKRQSDLGNAKSEAFGGLSKIRNLGLWNKEIETTLDHLSDQLKERFKHLEQTELSTDEIRAMEKTYKKRQTWREITRLKEAANLLKTIGHPKRYKILSDFLKLVPPFETIDRKAVQR